MSNDGWTQTPNYILDNMANMKPAVFKVCMAVVRQTCGYIDRQGNRKEWDRLSTSRIMKLTGLSNRAVIDAVEEATNEGWIERRQAGQYFEYRIQPMKKVHSISNEEAPTYENSSQVDEKTYENSSQETYENSSQVDPTYENSSQEPMKKVHTQKKVYKENKTQGNGASLTTGDKLMDAAVAKQNQRSKPGGSFMQDWQVDLNKRLPAKERRVMAEGLAAMFGLTAKMETDDKTLRTMHEQAASLFDMGYTSLEAITKLFDLWMTDDWRRKNRDKLTVFKFTDFASLKKQEHDKAAQPRQRKTITIFNQYTEQYEERVIQ